jgi:hypothetical protein
LPFHLPRTTPMFSLSNESFAIEEKPWTQAPRPARTRLLGRLE